MKKITLIAIAAIFFATTGTQAQVKRSHDATQKVQKDTSRKHRGERLKDLELTTDQKAKMKELRERNQQQREAIKNDASLSEEQKRAKMQELYKNQKQSGDAVLTPDQKAKLKAAQHKGRDAHKKGKGVKKDEINFTPDQRTRMNTIREGFKKQTDAVKNDASLSKEQKAEKLKQLRSRQQEQMKTIRTPDQKTKMEANRKKMNGEKRMKAPNKNMSTLPGRDS